MNVRNFWGTVYVQGRQSPITFGPKAKEDGFSLVLKIRQDGAISENELHIEGIVHADGELIVEAWTKKKNSIGTFSLGILLTGRR